MFFQKSPTGVFHRARFHTSNSLISHCGAVVVPFHFKERMKVERIPSGAKICKQCEAWKERVYLTSLQEHWLEWQKKAHLEVKEA
jgi:hypothetical protein